MSGLPCPWRDCRCTHTAGCEAGWLDDAVPCPVCRPELSEALWVWQPKLEPDGRPEVMDGIKRSETVRALPRTSRQPSLAAKGPARPDLSEPWTPGAILDRLP